jgi:HTH-type transcriptional regulator, sugar sensing transcriptional regulator
LSSDDASVSYLRQLGLNLYESKAYLALLAKGQISAKELGQVTSIPQSRTYDVLSSLKDKGFALITPSSNKTYSPAQPDRILSDLYGKKKKEIQAEMIRVQEQTEKRLEELNNIYSQASKQLAAVSSDHTQVTNQPVFVIEGSQNIEHAMLNLIDRAEKEFLRITRPPDSRKNMLDPFYFLPGTMFDHFARAEQRGVKIRTLSLVREIPSLLGWVYQDEEGNQRRYLEKEDDIPEKFVLVDECNALLNLRDPISKTFGSIGLLLESGPTCAILGEHFESMWRKAESPSSVAKRMKKKSEEVISMMRQFKFTKAEISTYKSLSKNGYQSLDSLIKSLGRHHSSTEITVAVQRLLKKGMLLQNDWLKSLMAEDPYKITSLFEKSSTNGGE